MEKNNDLKDLYALFIKVKEDIVDIRKYKSKKKYKDQYEKDILALNRAHMFLKAKIIDSSIASLIEKFKKINDAVQIVLEPKKYDKKLEVIKELERYWPELEVQYEGIRFKNNSFSIPDEIPIKEYRLDLEEAIKDFDNGCFISAIVLCRRAYEGALVDLYKTKNGNEPIEDTLCKHCKAVIRNNSYIGITRLHNWAIDNNYITNKLKQAGFLLTELGAGAAHTPLLDFPRDREMANLGITATITLLKELSIKA